MLKVAIIGCGKIADAHASEIQRIPGCRIVGVCDREELMAKQLQDRFPIDNYFGSVEELFSKAVPDVVHITTPPQSHFSLGQLCLEHGCHVYIEKPFTINASEARQLIDLAVSKNLKITAGHDDQFRHAARRMRALVKDGYLGGEPVHLESYYCYELVENSGYAKALLADKEHWVRKLPGKLLHNVISHGIARIAEYFKSDSPSVVAHGFVSPTLSRGGESEIVDEVRVIVSENNQKTAYFTFSSQMRPSLHQFRIFGPANALVMDQDNETLVRIPGHRRTSFLEHFVSPLGIARQYIGNVSGNILRFIKRDFHMKAGMKWLIEAFYRSITEGAPVPIEYREIILTAQIMDSIFDQIASRPSSEV